MNRRNFMKTSATLLGATAFSQVGMINWASASTPLRIGILIPFSGPAGLFGASCKNCAQLAIDELNAVGGILGRTIEPVYVDVGVPPADAAQSVLRLWKGKRAEAFIGMHDSAVRGALVNLFKGQVPYIYTPVYEGGGCADGLYTIGETPSQQLKPVIPWLAEQKAASKWYLIGNDYNWPRDTNALAKEYIAASGGTIVGEEYLPFTVDNFDSNLAKIKDSGADAVLITLVGGASVGFNRAFASFGLADRVIRLGTLIEENTLAGIGEESSKNLYSSAGYFATVNTPEAKEFANNYMQKYGANAPVLNTLAESCYDGVLLLNALAKKASSLSTNKLANITDGVSYNGPRGHISLAHGSLTSNIYLSEAKGTAFEVVKTFKHIASENNCMS